MVNASLESQEIVSNNLNICYQVCPQCSSRVLWTRAAMHTRYCTPKMHTLRRRADVLVESRQHDSTFTVSRPPIQVTLLLECILHSIELLHCNRYFCFLDSPRFSDGARSSSATTIFGAQRSSKCCILSFEARARIHSESLGKTG